MSTVKLGLIRVRAPQAVVQFELLYLLGVVADVLADSVGCSGSSLDSVTSGRVPTVSLVGLVAAGSVV